MSDYLRGYGGRWPDVTWPNGARLAVSLVVNFEEGAEVSVGAGDPVNEKAGDLSSGMPAGVRDIAMEQMFAYGTRAGFWRVLDGLKRAGTPATYLVCGRAAERLPDLVRAIVDHSHEAACHGYRWANHALMTDAAEEEAEIRRAVEAIASAAGITPRGFYGRWGPSPHTRAILRRLGFLYDSNAYDDDLPYWDEMADGLMLVLPYALDSNDWRFVEGDPWGTPQAWLDYLKAAIEVLLREGGEGHPRLFNIGLHLRIVGRPGRFWALEALLAHLTALGDQVWVARREDIARHWISACPAPK